jgi:hypothetical protein
MRIGQEKDDADWLHYSAVKAQMKRMDPSFSEKVFGLQIVERLPAFPYRPVDLDETSTTRMVRLHRGTAS